MATGSKTKTKSKSKSKTIRYEEFIDERLGQVRSFVKMRDVATGILSWLAGLLMIVVAMVVVDHWIADLGLWGRLLGFMALVSWTVVVMMTRIVPSVVRSINPAYAAKVLEDNEPSLGNSLLNLVFFRNRRHEMKEVVYRAVESDAAKRLAPVQIEDAIDQSNTIRTAIVLAGLFIAFGVYTVVSPKSPFQTLARIAAPWLNLGRPARVRIHNIEPGDTEVYFGRSLTVSAGVDRIDEDEPVRLIYSTADEQVVDREVMMELDSSGVYRAELRSDGEGIRRNLNYRIEAGDAVAGPYRVRVVPAPSIVVDRIEYDYPDYTQLPNEVVEHDGDISALEGTRVTVYATANQPISSAYLEFDAERTSATSARDTVSMESDGDQTNGSFILLLKPDRSTPVRQDYRLRFVNAKNESNAQPIVHNIDVSPDLVPEVEILRPRQRETEVPENRSVGLAIRAIDPDFQLSSVKLHAVADGEPVATKELLDAPYSGVMQRSLRFVPRKIGLKAGDVVVVWATAADNRQHPMTGADTPNVSKSQRFIIRVTEPAARGDEQGEQSGDQQNPDNQPADGEGDGSGSEGASGEDGSGGENGNGENGNGENGNGENGNGESGNRGENGDSGNGEQQSGESGSSEQGGGNDRNGSQGEGQQGQGNESQDNGNSSGMGQTGESGEEQNSDGSEGGQGQQSGGANGQGAQDGQRQSGGKQGREPNGGADGNASESSGNSGESGSENSGRGQRNPPGQRGAENGGDSSGRGQGDDNQGESSEPIASDGSQDGDAFERILERMQRDGQQPNDSGGGASNQDQASGASNDPNQPQRQGGEQQGGEQQGGEQQGGEQQGGEQQGGEQQGGEQQGGEQQGGEQQGGEQQGGEQQGGGQQGGDQQGGEQQGGEQQGGGQQGGDQQGGGQQGGDQQGGEEQGGGQQGGEQQGGDQQGGGQQGGEQQGGEQQGGDQQGGEQQGGEQQPGEQQSGGEQSQNGQQPRPGQDQPGRRQEGGEQRGGQRQPNGSQSGDGERGQGGAQQPGEQGGRPSGDAGSDATGNRSGQDTPGSAANPRAGQSSPDGARAGDDSQGDGQGRESSGDSSEGAAGQENVGSDNPTANQTENASEATEGASGESSGSSRRPGDRTGRSGDAEQQAEQKTSDSPDARNPQQSNPNGAAGNQPGTGNAAEGEEPPVGDDVSNPGADPANLEYARKATKLALDYLKHNADQELLDELGWTPQELNQFVQRWEQLHSGQQVEQPGDGQDGKFDEILRSLGLQADQDRTRGFGQRSDAPGNVGDRGTRSRPPSDYLEQYKAFLKRRQLTDEQ